MDVGQNTDADEPVLSLNLAHLNKIENAQIIELDAENIPDQVLVDLMESMLSNQILKYICSKRYGRIAHRAITLTTCQP